MGWVGIVFLGGTHVGVALFGLVLGRWWHMDDGRIDNAAAGQQKTLSTMVDNNRPKYSTGPAVFLWQVAKLQDHRHIRKPTFSQLLQAIYLKYYPKR